MRTSKGFYSLLIAGALSLSLMAGCGGGGGGGDSATPAAPVAPVATPAPAASFKMPDTNQTTSYTTTFGEDHNYTINPPSYTDNGDGTVKDNVTGLAWQKQDDGVSKTWVAAGTYCDNLSLGGHTDWRLPSQIELISILDNGVYSPAINATYFPGTASSYYWSSTADAYFFTQAAWAVNFNDGNSYDRDKTFSFYARCVRGGQTTTSLTDNGNGTVTDNTTSLMWQQCSSGESGAGCATGTAAAYTWEAAISNCEGLSFGGFSDWRLPNHKELLSLVNYTRYSPSINTTFFPGTMSSAYWSSTTNAHYTSWAWGVYFDIGFSYDYLKSNVFYVRCVRGGQ